MGVVPLQKSWKQSKKSLRDIGTVRESPQPFLLLFPSLVFGEASSGLGGLPTAALTDSAPSLSS